MIDLNTYDAQVAQALNRMREPMMSKAVEFIEAELDLAKQKLVHADTARIGRLQGRAEAFEDLLEAINQSPRVVETSRP